MNATSASARAATLVLVVHSLTVTAVCAAAQAAPPNLAGAIRAAAPPKEIAIAVEAENARPIQGAALAPPGSPLALAVAPFDHRLQSFGAITAIAPANRVTLATTLPQSNPFRDVPPREAFTILAASLTDAQRNAMLSEQGIGVGDLTTDMQRGLFLTLFPTQRIEFFEKSGDPQDTGPGTLHAVENPMQNGRLRVGASMRMTAYSVGQDLPGLTPIMRDPGGPKIHDPANQQHIFNAATVDGVRVRWTEPNALKSGQLNFDADVLKRPISLSGLPNVGALIARIAETTGLEIYADRRYEKRSLTILNADRSARAGDLLRALCLCLAGAFRKLGPAYVLTDDVSGVGSRRQRIVNLQADGEAQRAGPLRQAEDFLQDTGAFWKARLGGFGDGMLPSEDQARKEDRDVLGAGMISMIRLPFDQFSPMQKQAIQQYSDGLSRQHDANPNGGIPPGIDFNRPIELNVTVSIQLLIPGVNGAIDTDLGQWVAESFHDMSKFRPQRNRKAHAGPAGDGPVPGPALADLSGTIGRRALLCNARNPEQLAAAVAKMKQMGLNELWLPVFTSGEAALPGLRLTAADEERASLLKSAIDLARGAGIRVFPVVDLFAWGRATRRDLLDLTIIGETSYEDARRRHARSLLLAAADGRDADQEPLRRETISPLAPAAARDLAEVERFVASLPGIAGVIWRETCPEGYDAPDRLQHIEPAGRLGYTEAARLAFLRKEHADPIDVTPTRTMMEMFERADLSLPQFDDYALDGQLDRQWRKACNDANIGFLNGMFEAVRSAPLGHSRPEPPGFELLVRERRDNFGSGWYAAWLGPNTPLPTSHMPFEDGNQDPPYNPVDADVQAHSQSKVALLRLPVGRSLEEAAVRRQWSGALRGLASNKKWEGFVLEMEALEP
ncbi:MAG TPA: hypothetical protein VKT77_22330 [Chthonomonadaceae bacterium]|nr:hypothetical protein [Chthonomonadaceae bacterium]